MVEELKKTCKEKIVHTFLHKAIKFFVSKYSFQNDFLSNNLKLIKDDQNIGIFFALNGDN